MRKGVLGFGLGVLGVELGVLGVGVSASLSLVSSAPFRCLIPSRDGLKVLMGGTAPFERGFLPSTRPLVGGGILRGVSAVMDSIRGLPLGEIGEAGVPFFLGVAWRPFRGARDGKKTTSRITVPVSQIVVMGGGSVGISVVVLSSGSIELTWNEASWCISSSIFRFRVDEYN
jgi:hypothetical protein